MVTRVARRAAYARVSSTYTRKTRIIRTTKVVVIAKSTICSIWIGANTSSRIAASSQMAGVGCCTDYRSASRARASLAAIVRGAGVGVVTAGTIGFGAARTASCGGIAGSSLGAHGCARTCDGIAGGTCAGLAARVQGTKVVVIAGRTVSLCGVQT